MSATKELYLDEGLALGFDLVKDRGYPRLTGDEAQILRRVADGLCISQAALFWAYHDGEKGDDKGWRRLRERLLSKPVRMVKA